ncbi:hypothetical protein ACKI1K_44620, partial [Streptomyces scabiei]|uniref:hypothetical protein n=1 Tax=Streptomyces scabiei TaxID=1930 RepID=UPI0038F6226B
PREERDLFPIKIDDSSIEVVKPEPHVSMKDLVTALVDVLKRAELSARHHIQMEALSVREKMTHILLAIQNQSHLAFESLFDLHEGKLGVVV